MSSYNVLPNQALLFWVYAPRFSRHCYFMKIALESVKALVTDGFFCDEE